MAEIQIKRSDTDNKARNVPTFEGIEDELMRVTEEKIREITSVLKMLERERC